MSSYYHGIGASTNLFHHLTYFKRLSLMLNWMCFCPVDTCISEYVCLGVWHVVICADVSTVLVRLLARCVSITLLRWWTSTAPSAVKRSTCSMTWMLASKASSPTGSLLSLSFSLAHSYAHTHAHTQVYRCIWMSHGIVLGCLVSDNAIRVV